MAGVIVGLINEPYLLSDKGSNPFFEKVKKFGTNVSNDTEARVKNKNIWYPVPEFCIGRLVSKVSDSRIGISY